MAMHLTMLIRAQTGHRYWAGAWLGLAALLGLIISSTVPASALDKPAGKVILTVTGEVSQKNSGEGAQFDRHMLSSLPQHTVRTETPWTDGLCAFEGPLLRDVLKETGASGGRLVAIAHNDYSINIPTHDAMDNDVILALRKDGAVLTLRERGPVWIIYPWSDHPALKAEDIYARAVWQLKAIRVEHAN